MADYRVEFEEAFRFQELIASMRLPDAMDDEESISESGYGNEEEGVWEARTASMALVNALTNCPESLEDRVLLREEFSRRGLNEVIVVSTVSVEFIGTIAHGMFPVTDAAVYQASRVLGHPTRRLHGREVRG